MRTADAFTGVIGVQARRLLHGPPVSGVRGGVRWQAADVMSAVTGACALLLPDGAEKQPRGSSHSQLATH